MKLYRVKECFRTIQGEGTHAGTPAVFLRLVGCNMWSGYEEDRERDSQRNSAQCPLWCDTDFTKEGSLHMNAAEVAQMIERKMHPTRVPLIVITGGEPLLQVDDELLQALAALPGNPLIAIETNGTTEPKFDMIWTLENVWITCSPKQPRSMLKLGVEMIDELKLVVPAYDPAEWQDIECDKFMQPVADRTERDVNVEQEVAQLVIDNGEWRLSLQTHKIVRVP